MSGLNHVCTNSFVAFVILTYSVVFGSPSCTCYSVLEMLCSFCCDTIYALVLIFYTACGGWGGGVRGRGYNDVFTICMRETCTRSESCLNGECANTFILNTILINSSIYFKNKYIRPLYLQEVIT